MTLKLLWRLADVGADGDRELDAEIWHLLGDHSATNKQLLELAAARGMPTALDAYLGASVWRKWDARMPLPITRSIDDALAFGRQLLRYREPRFGIMQHLDEEWHAVIIVGTGEDQLTIESKHPHPAIALVQGAMRHHLLAPRE